LKYLIIKFVNPNKPVIHSDNKNVPFIFNDIRSAEDEVKKCKSAFIVTLNKPIISKHPKSIL
jgi:hypothetical protein